MKIKHKDKKTLYKIIGVIICLIISSVLLFTLLKVINNQSKPVVQQIQTNTMYDEYKEIYNNNKSINDDYMGIIKFDSDLINQPFVKSKLSNIREAYLEYERLDWKTGEESIEGTVFMDPYATLDSQNITLYGHYVYPEIDSSGTHMFTPLHKLKDKKEYYDNNKITLYLSNEFRKYEIVYVYYADIINGSDGSTAVPKGLEYMRTTFNEKQMAEYKNQLIGRLFYNTGKELEFTDRFLTLQTCVENRNDLRLIVVAKEIDRVSYSE